MTLPVPLVDFETYLHNTDVDVSRAQMILDLAHVLCESVENPLPAGAEAVVLDVAGRAYAVPPEGVGPYATPPAAATSGGGLWLTPSNEATLRRLAGERHAPLGSFPCAQPWPDAHRVFPPLTWAERIAWSPNL